MKKNLKHQISLGIIAVLGLIAIITATRTVMGNASIFTTPPNDSGHVGLTPAEQKAIALLPSTPPEQPTLSSEKQARLDNEFKMHELAKNKVFDLSKDPNNGQAYWSVESISGITFQLQNALDVPRKVGQIKFTGLDQIRVDISFTDNKTLRKDLIVASQLIFKQAPEINNIEFLLYQVNSDYTDSVNSGAVTTTRSDIVNLNVDLADADSVLKAFNEHFDDSQFKSTETQ